LRTTPYSQPKPSPSYSSLPSLSVLFHFRTVIRLICISLLFRLVCISLLFRLVCISLLFRLLPWISASSGFVHPSVSLYGIVYPPVSPMDSHIHPYISMESCIHPYLPWIPASTHISLWNSVSTRTRPYLPWIPPPPHPPLSVESRIHPPHPLFSPIFKFHFRFFSRPIPAHPSIPPSPFSPPPSGSAIGIRVTERVGVYEYEQGQGKREGGVEAGAPF
jgi:hypothetical protein